MKEISAIPEKWVFNGFTISHIQGKTAFLTGGIPGKENIFIIEKETSKLIYARAKAVSSDCMHFPTCGGCSYRHISYEEEIQIKKEELIHCLGFDTIQDSPIQIHTGPIEGYRNNVQWQTSSGKIGFHSRFSNHVVDLKETGCKNLHPLLVFPKDPKSLKWRISENKIIPYDRQESIVSFGNLNLKFPPNSFQQINHYLWKEWILVLQKLIKEFINPNPMVADESGRFSCLELFCGVGTIGLLLGESLSVLKGIEISKEAIRYAKQNAKILKNQLPHIKTNYTSLDLYKRIDANYIPDYPVWILNPPREGIGMEIINLIPKKSPAYIIYSSCDPHTLGRDWKRIQETDEGYTPLSIHLMDFFPRTKHFETVILFGKKDFQDKIQE